MTPSELIAEMRASALLRGVPPEVLEGILLHLSHRAGECVSHEGLHLTDLAEVCAWLRDLAEEVQR